MGGKDLMGRVKALLTERGISQAAFARALEISPQTLSAWLASRNRPTVDHVARMCEVLRVSPSWLITGREDSVEHQSLVCEDCVSIPVFDVRASCGNGQVVERAAVVSLIQVNKSWVNRHCGDANPRALNVLGVTGDSMAPTLNDGDFVIIDTSATRIFTDAMYAFSLDDDLFIKRIQRVGRDLCIISDNDRYRSFTLTSTDLEHGFKVHGRVTTRCLVRKE